MLKSIEFVCNEKEELKVNDIILFPDYKYYIIVDNPDVGTFTLLPLKFTKNKFLFWLRKILVILKNRITTWKNIFSKKLRSLIGRNG